MRQGDVEIGSIRFENKCGVSLFGRFKPANYKLLVCIRYLHLQSMVKKFSFGKLMRHRAHIHIVHNNIVHLKIAIDSEPASAIVVRKVYANSKPVVCIVVVNRNISQVEHLVVHGEGGPPPNAPRLNMAHLCTPTFRMDAVGYQTIVIAVGLAFEKSAGALGAHRPRWDPFVNAAK
jgi:hypothetical protein